VTCGVAKEELHQHKKDLGTNGNNRGSKRGEQRKNSHGIQAPVKPTREEYLHRLNRRGKNTFTGSTDVAEPAAKKRTAPVDPTWLFE